MQSYRTALLLLTLSLALPGCALTGKGVSPPVSCPQPQPPPPALMTPPAYEQTVRGELFEPLPSAKPTSEGSKPTH